MAVDIQNYNPMYMLDPPDRPDRYGVSSEEWNNLWSLIVQEANNTSEAMALLLDKLKDELWADNAATTMKNLPLREGSGTTVASQLSWLLSQLDGKTTEEYVNQIAAAFVLGQLSPGSITYEMLAESAKPKENDWGNL